MNVTQHPAGKCTAQQIITEIPSDSKMPRQLHRDRNTIYGLQSSAIHAPTPLIDEHVADILTDIQKPARL